MKAFFIAFSLIFLFSCYFPLEKAWLEKQQIFPQTSRYINATLNVGSVRSKDSKRELGESFLGLLVGEWRRSVPGFGENFRGYTSILSLNELGQPSVQGEHFGADLLILVQPLIYARYQTEQHRWIGGPGRDYDSVIQKHDDDLKLKGKAKLQIWLYDTRTQEVLGPRRVLVRQSFIEEDLPLIQKVAYEVALALEMGWELERGVDPPQGVPAQNLSEAISKWF